MTDVDAISLVQKAIWLTMSLSGPIVLSAMFIGTAIAFVQALTQVQEMTLTFLPKMVAALLIIALSGSYTGGLLMAFTEDVYGYIALGQQ
ncbi:MAG: flagellar biosynthetic protein FliQ [Hyphomicrobium sp.]